MSEVTQLLRAATGGDPRAAAELLPLVYEELRKLAAHRMANEPERQTLQPTALVHEAWLRLVGDDQQVQFRNRAHFFAAAAEAMRRILIENARRKARLKHGGSLERVELEGLPVAAPNPDETLLALDEALKRLERDDPERARLVSLKFFAGFRNQEAAGLLGVTERTVERKWAFARAWLFREIRQSR